MNHRFVAFGEIDLNDSAFEIRKFGGQVRLRDSLAGFGILDPPWLLEKGARYTVVDGFKRLNWARQNGVHGTFCRIFPENTDIIELWSQRIEKKLFDAEIDIAEKSRIISVLLKMLPDGIPRLFLAALNVPNRPELWRQWVSISEQDPETLRILASGIIAERTALEVCGWSQRSRILVLDLLSALRCSASIQVEIVERIHEIAIREQKTRADILESLDILEILSAKDWNHRQKTHALRELLAAMRNPRLTARTNQFRQEIESLDLPPPVRIIPPVSFEGNNWRMELSFSGPEELGKALDSTGSLVKSGRMDILLNPRPRRKQDEQSR